MSDLAVGLEARPRMRGVSSSLAITTAQGAAGLERLAALARSADTLVVLMPRGSLAEIAAALIPAVGAARPAAVIASATLPGQRSVTARLDGIARAADEAGVDTPATLVVGEVVNAVPANSLVNSLVEATAGFKFG